MTIDNYITNGYIITDGHYYLMLSVLFLIVEKKIKNQKFLISLKNVERMINKIKKVYN